MLDRLAGFQNEREAMFAQTTKLTEEVGELAEAVIALHKLQRADKTSDHQHEHLAEECADVIITTLIIADRVALDIDAALAKKIEKINARFSDCAHSLVSPPRPRRRDAGGQEL
jgi:NTP pyrophosphatase (non-canonical NTP hydrolase)